MALCSQLQILFDQERATYRLLHHTQAFTASEVAATSHVPGRELAKVVVLRDQAGAFLMVALPAPAWVDVPAVASATARQDLRLAEEHEFAPLFPDCEAGTMPPFGGPYGLPLYVDACLSRSPEIAFQAGNHQEIVVMDYADYARLARPIVEQSCFHRTKQRAAS